MKTISDFILLFADCRQRSPRTWSCQLVRGLPTGYTRSKVTVRNVDGNPADAWIYIATNPITTRQLRSYTWYKRFLVVGAQENLLPLDYVAQLQTIDSTIDSDRKRHAEKWALIRTSPTG